MPARKEPSLVTRRHLRQTTRQQSTDGEEHEDLREGVVAQRVDAPAASIRRRRRHRSPSVVAVQKVAAGVSARFVLY
jgi:hypothetical protein